jgi:hypothetical protein
MTGTTIVCVSLIAINLIFIGQSFAKIDPGSIIGIWLLDEGKGEAAKDSSPNNNDGTLNKGPKWVDGKFDKALEFDGKDDYVQIPPSPLFNSKEFTVTFWMFPYVIGGNNPAGKGTSTLVVANGNPGDGGGANWWFEFWNGGNFEFKSCKPDCSAAVTSVNIPNKWYFVAGTYDGTNYGLYIDGELKSTGPDEVDATQRGLLIGSGLCPAGHGCDGGYYKGVIDDVAMFNGVLAGDDIKSIMNKGLGKELGIASVELTGKLTVTWGSIKAR